MAGKIPSMRRGFYLLQRDIHTVEIQQNNIRRGYGFVKHPLANRMTASGGVQHVIDRPTALDAVIG